MSERIPPSGESLAKLFKVRLFELTMRNQNKIINHGAR